MGTKATTVVSDRDMNLLEQSVTVSMDTLTVRGRSDPSSRGVSGAALYREIESVTKRTAQKASIYAALERLYTRGYISYQVCATREKDTPGRVDRMNQRPSRRGPETAAEFSARFEAWENRGEKIKNKRDGESPSAFKVRVEKWEQRRPERRTDTESEAHFRVRLEQWEKKKGALCGVANKKGDGDGRRSLYRLETAGRIALANSLAGLRLLLDANTEAGGTIENEIQERSRKRRPVKVAA